MFVFALILNPYEQLDRFGDQAGVNVFALNTQLNQVHHIISYLYLLIMKWLGVISSSKITSATPNYQ